MSECEEECSLFTTSKGGTKLFKNGFTYERNRTVNNKFYWCCELRNKKMYNCTSTAITELCNGVHKVLKYRDTHNHKPDPNRKCVSEFKEKLKNDSLADGPINALKNARSSVPTDLLEHLPSTYALKQVIYRHKRKNAVKEPTDIVCEINSEHTKIRNDNFIIKDRIFDDNKRILIMSSVNMMITLSHATYWVLDSTFTEAPNLFKHLFSIHGNIITDIKETFPLCFALCTNKDKRTYDILFALLLEYGKEQGLNLVPKACVLEFETAAIQSLRSNFEEIYLQGCLFHMWQMIFREVNDQGFAKKYATDIQFKKEVKCFLALCYLEEYEIYLYFNSILERFKDPDWLQIAHWFDKYFVHETPTTKLKFQPSFWSSHETYKFYIPRIQKAAEAWHYKINNLIDKHKPGVYDLIKQLITETMANEKEIENILTGATPKKKKRSEYKEDKIGGILAKKSTFTEENFLMAIAANL